MKNTISRIFVLSLSLFMFLLFSQPVSAAGMNPYVRLGIITVGSAVACYYIADAATSDEDYKADNARTSAIICGSIAAAYSAMDSSFAENQVIENKDQWVQKQKEEEIPNLNLALTPKGLTLLFNANF
jgi:hypothetical protein